MILDLEFETITINKAQTQLKFVSPPNQPGVIVGIVLANDGNPLQDFKPGEKYRVTVEKIT